MSERATFDLATRLRSPGGAPLGEVFSFLSGLYFRGKLAYGRRFACAPDGVELSRAMLVVRSTAINPIALALTIGAGLVLVALWSRRLFRRRQT